MIKHIYLTFLILIFSLATLFSQEIKVNKVTIVKNDISAREYEILDANRDASALLKVRLSLKDLAFETDLGINKIEERDGEIWLWVPPGTRALSVITSNPDTVVVKLPSSLEKYSVCVILFTIIVNKDVQTIDLPSLTFNTKPQNAEVFINDLSQGKSPVTVSMMPDSFMYRIERKHFRSFSGSDILPTAGKAIDLKLKSKSRIFVQVNSDFFMPATKNIGFTAGVIGETGFYLSYIFPVKSIKSDLSITSANDNLNFDNFYLEPEGSKNALIRHNYLVLGVTQTFYKKFVLSAGYAYGRTELYQLYNAVSYSNNILPTEMIVHRVDKDNKSGGFDLGLSYWIKDRIIVSMNSTSFVNTKMITDEFGNLLLGANGIIISDLKLGLGCSF